jgi:phosphoribosylglycinamide formyltransferase-1
MPAPPLPIAVLISGSGRTLENLIRRAAAGTLDVDIRLVVSSRPNAGGLRHAADAHIPTLVVDNPRATGPEAFRDAIFQPCRRTGVRMVAMAGFVKHLLIPHDFQNRVINIHPALIPAFCGQGYYGERVHQAVIDYGAKVSGCTVHFVDNQYDHGPVILQRTVPVLDDDTVDTLAARVFVAECAAYPEALQLLAENRVRIAGRRVWISS